MTLAKIPFILAGIWAVHTTLTPVVPPVSPEERIRPVGLDVWLMPKFVKTCFYTASTFEILVLLARKYPQNVFSDTVLNLLVHTTPQIEALNLIRITSPFLVGCGLAVTGALIRKACYHEMGRMFTFELSIRKDHQLVTTGPYAIVRHPSYAGASCALYGAFLCQTSAGSWFVHCSGIFQNAWQTPLLVSCWALTFFVGLSILGPRVVKEDTSLKQHFGTEWDNWARKVPYRLIPGVY